MSAEQSWWVRLVWWSSPMTRMQLEKEAALFGALHAVEQSLMTLTQWTMAVDDRLARIEESVR